MPNTPTPINDQNWQIDRSYAKWVTIVALILGIGAHIFVIAASFFSHFVSSPWIALDGVGLIALLYGGITQYKQAPNGGVDAWVTAVMWLGALFFIVTGPIAYSFYHNS